MIPHKKPLGKVLVLKENKRIKSYLVLELFLGMPWAALKDLEQCITRPMELPSTILKLLTLTDKLRLFGGSIFMNYNYVLIHSLTYVNKIVWYGALY